ncbi:1,4-dihydroxy-2-naphthoate octaprenyltransferase [Actinomyces bovis]|uniref:1,4-dihydroxy-2-naphthoate octaprenyltransferase n=1 Tax=Actinomyces bovis TaxID=1658 RepID=A0ABY1VLQ8_9ACTO|nr:1,4-dihydroxy-2-naphthoate octaprenyltransferase [Actinomyces bovis]
MTTPTGIRGTDDDRTGPPRLTASGQVAPKTVKYAAFGCFGLAGLFGLALLALSGQWWMLLLGVAAVAAAWFYTGGPHPYGYAGLGEVFVFLFFGLMATVGTTYLQTGTAPGWVWLAACGIGLIACSLLMVNNLRDIHTDPAHGKRTLAVRLGETRARQAFTAMIGAPVPLALAALSWARWADRGDGNALGGSIQLLVMTAVLGWLALRTTRTVRAGASGRALIPALRDAGLFELVYGVVVGLAFITVTAA